jgi:N-acetylglucosaminyl-diphospho-decaprenol L-rhamnosyltransferase
VSRLSIACVNWRNASELAGLLASIAEHPPGCEWDMTVVNNSPEEPVEIPGPLAGRLRLLQPGGNLGFGRAINLAFADSTADYLLVLNPDVRVTEGACDIALGHLEANPRAGLVFPLLTNPDGSRQRSVRRFYTWPVALWARCPGRRRFAPAFFDRHLLTELDATNGAVEVDWGLGAAVFIRRAALGGGPVFDPRFFLYFEDVDLGMRIWNSGWKAVYLPAARCVHWHMRASASRPFGAAGRHHAASFFKFMLKWGGLPGRPACRDAAGSGGR